jgi:hypothetical protein
MGKREGDQISLNQHRIKQTACLTLHLCLQTELSFSWSTERRNLKQLQLEKLKTKLFLLQRRDLFSFNACFLSVDKLNFP